MAVDTENNKDPKNEENPMQKLEEALVICRFGKFNIMLMCATFCAVFTSVMVTTTSSYILPIAECDLGMTIMQKGILTAMPFFGQVIATLVTGFATDAFGRKIFLVGGHLGIFCCTILEASSQNYWVLLTGKFTEGVFLSASYAASSVMVSEFTHKNVRDRALLLWASFMSISLILSALISWGILPQNWNFVIWEGYFELHSWNIYLCACSIGSLLATIIYYFIPESPKYLLTKGHEEEALEILKKVYAMNTGKDKDSFPMTSLKVTESFKSENKDTFSKKIVEAMFEVKVLLRQPLLGRLCLFLLINFLSLFAYSSVRLWFPQMLTIVETYHTKNGGTDRFCVMIDDYTNGLISNSSIVVNDTETGVLCVPHVSGFDTYLSGVIMGCVSLMCFAINGYLVKFVGQKPLICISLLLCGCSSGALFWTNSLIQIALLLSFTCAFMQTAAALVYNVLVRVFPTSVRSLTFSLVTMVGRIGSLSGSILFPIMLQTACMSPLISLTIMSLCVAGFVIFLPNPNKENNGTGDR